RVHRRARPVVEERLLRALVPGAPDRLLAGALRRRAAVRGRRLAARPDAHADRPDRGAGAGRLGRDSLLPVLRDPAGAPWKDEAYCEYYGHSTNRPQRMLRSGRWKLCYYLGEPVELYDLAVDPSELEDLAGRPHVRAVQEALT